MASGGSGTSLGKQLRTLFGVGTLTGLTDAELLDRSLARDADSSEAAFGVLVERHGPMVLGVCRRMLGDGHLAEDAFQATFLILARRGASIRRGSSIGGWLHRVARRTALRARKQADRRRSIENAEVDPDAVAVNLPEPVECRELRSAIDEELDRLNEGQRQAVVLCCIQGMSHEQAAGVLRWPVGTVKSRLGRGREQLRLRLTRRGLAPSVAWPLGADLLGAKLTVSVPKALADASAKSAFQFVAGSSALGAIASAVATLANGELTTMMLGKWKAIAMILVSGSAVAGATGFAVAWSSGNLKEGSALMQAASRAVQAVRGDSPTILSAHGKVVDAQGKPIAGATIYLREWSSWRMREVPFDKQEAIIRGADLQDVIAQTKTDAEGRFEFKEVRAPALGGKAFTNTQFQPWDVIAVADGYGLAWRHLTSRNRESALTLSLTDDATIRGRVIEPGGKPVAGAKVRPRSILPLGGTDRGGMGDADHLDLAWSSLPIFGITDADGRFQIRGLPRDRQFGLATTEPHHEMKYVQVATTDGPRADMIRRRVDEHGVPYELRSPILTGDLTIETKPTDHRLVGRVVFEANGKPAAGARVLTGFRKPRKTDADGRFEIAEIPAGKLELHLHAYGQDSAPLDLSIDIPAEPKIHEKTFTLPRGLIIQGKVVDGANQTGIGGVVIHYSSPEHLPEGQLPTLFGLTAKTESDGKFRIVVPAGRGILRLQELPPAYDLQKGPLFTMRPGRPKADDGLSRNIEGVSGQTLEGVDFALNRGGTLTFRVLDPEGKQIPGALVKRKDFLHANKPAEKTNGEGRFAAEGLDPNTRYTFDVFHPTKNLGARFVSPAAASHEGPMSFEVKLKPLGAVEGKVLDENGKSLPEAHLRLGSSVELEYPRSLGVTEATLDAIQSNGSFRFDRLIPEVEYYLGIESPGFAKVQNDRFTLKSGETHKLPEYRLPVFDRVLSGVIVDRQGKPVAGAAVSYDQFSPPIRYSPSGKHFQDTDEQGQFRLDGLPRGKIKVMAYRHPAPPSNRITNMARVEVEPGKTEIRIELPDANQRLQGIED